MEQTQVQQNRVVVVSQPGLLRDALVSWLASFAGVGDIACAGGSLTALDMIRQQPPHLLVIDNTLPEEEVAALVRQVKGEWPAIVCLVFSSTHRPQQQRHDAGADAIVPRHGSPQEMETTLRRLTRNGAV
ncbi:MAG: hypothetical protein Kow0031_09580 [Anaerolineae bacterium]